MKLLSTLLSLATLTCLASPQAAFAQQPLTVVYGGFCTDSLANCQNRLEYGPGRVLNEIESALIARGYAPRLVPLNEFGEETNYDASIPVLVLDDVLWRHFDAFIPRRVERCHVRGQIGFMVEGHFESLHEANGNGYWNSWLYHLTDRSATCRRAGVQVIENLPAALDL